MNQCSLYLYEMSWWFVVPVLYITTNHNPLPLLYNYQFHDCIFFILFPYKSVSQETTLKTPSRGWQSPWICRRFWGRSCLPDSRTVTRLLKRRGWGTEEQTGASSSRWSWMTSRFVNQHSEIISRLFFFFRGRTYIQSIKGVKCQVQRGTRETWRLTLR